MLTALFVVVAVTKTHELVPPISNLGLVKFVGAALVVAAVMQMNPAHLRAVAKTVTAKWVGVMVLLTVLSVPFGIYRSASLQFVAHELWKIVFLLAIVGAAVVNRQTMKAVIIAFVGGATLAAARIVAIGGADHGDVRSGLTYDANEAGLMFLVAIPFALYLASQRGKWRIVSLAAGLTLVAGLVRTGSRGGIVGLCILALWVIYRATPKRKLAAIIAVGVGAVILPALLDDTTRARFESILHLSQDYNVTAREGRIQIWKRGIGFMLTRPLLGVGVANYSVADGTLSGKKNVGSGIKFMAAHNSFIQVGAELGVMGLAAFVGMLWTAAAGCRLVKRRAFRLAGRSSLAATDDAQIAIAAEGALLAFAVTGFLLSMAYQMITYLLVALAVGVRVASVLPAASDGVGQEKVPLRRVRPCVSRTFSAVPIASVRR